MSYRIRYEVKRKDRRWMIYTAMALLTVMVLMQEYWYWDFARYVGEQIRGAR